MVLGVLFGALMVAIDNGAGGADAQASGMAKQLVIDWIKPFGTIFINVLKMIAIPLIVASLVKGVSDLKDLSSLSQMGFRTVGLYLLTTVVAVVIGLLVVNIVQPGKTIGEEASKELQASFSEDAAAKQDAAKAQQGKGPLQALVDVVPSNAVSYTHLTLPTILRV